MKAQLVEVKTQLNEASDYKITALERARKCDELQARLCELENERERLVGQLAAYKSRARSAVESSHERRVRDEHAITVGYYYRLVVYCILIFAKKQFLLDS